MPIYEYHCKSCQYHEELKLPITFPGKKKLPCPECGETTFKRQISKVNFIIKGAKAKNDYYIPPKNEDLGLPSERDLLKEQEKAEDFVDYLHYGPNISGPLKEELQDKKKRQKEKTAEAEKYYTYLKDKHRPFHDRLQKALDKSQKKAKREIDNKTRVDRVTRRIQKREEKAAEFKKQYPKLFPDEKVKIEEDIKK